MKLEREITHSQFSPSLAFLFWVTFTSWRSHLISPRHGFWVRWIQDIPWILHPIDASTRCTGGSIRSVWSTENHSFFYRPLPIR
jgi:hypothetical protein